MDTHITGSHFDYKNQAWTLNGRYVACGHPSCRDTASDPNQKYNCCYGTVHEGEIAPAENLPTATEQR